MRVKKRESLRKRLFYITASSLAEMAGDVFDHLANPYDIAGAGYRRHQRERAANLASRLRKVGEIEKVVKKDGSIYFCLTDKGKKRLIEEIPLLRFRRKKWDGKWRQVVFDIPEEIRIEREKLRHKLLSLGFGKLQRSVYIAPFDIAEPLSDFLEENNLSDYAIVFEMEKLSDESEQELAKVVWGLDGLHFRYLDFVVKWEKELDENEKISQEKFLECREEYFSILLDDPGLPRELLPDDWPASLANRVFREMITRARIRLTK
jgi:phenylacetic acid degradation operon negative regulatory protein